MRAEKFLCATWKNRIFGINKNDRRGRDFFEIRSTQCQMEIYAKFCRKFIENFLKINSQTIIQMSSQSRHDRCSCHNWWILKNTFCGAQVWTRERKRRQLWVPDRPRFGCSTRDDEHQRWIGRPKALAINKLLDLACETRHKDRDIQTRERRRKFRSANKIDSEVDTFMAFENFWCF